MSRKEQKPDLAFFSGNILSAHLDERDGEMLQFILNSIPQYVFWKDRNYVYQGCNRKFADAAGINKPEDICGLTDHDLPWTRQEADFYRLCDQRVMDNDQAEYDILEPQLQADSQQYWLRTNKIPLHNKAGEVIGILGAFDDVTDLIEKEKRLKHYEIITATVDDLMVIIGLDYRYQAVNDAYCTAFAQSREAIIGTHVKSVVGAKPFQETLKPEMDQAFAGTVVQFNSWQSFPGTGNKHVHCTYYPVFDDNKTVISVVAKIQDTTTTKRLENQLQQIQKMEAIGRLAGGIAHDFNNILSVINGYSDICLHQMEDDNPYRSKVEQIHQAGIRATRLTQQLLGFSRKQIVPPRSLNLAEEFSGMSPMLGRLLGATIEIETVVEPDLWLIKLDRSQFEQIVLNLAVNSRDAMADGGQLRVDIRNRSLRSNEELERYALGAGDYVTLSFSDTGIGMNTTIQSRIFEPFFTTKPKEIGTGFGLSTVYGIVQQNCGHIAVESEVGRGTTFSLFFPRCDVDTTAGPGHATSGGDTLRRGSGTILLAEDDHALRTMCVGILADLGYTILEASNGKEAVEAANRYHGKIDLFLTDVVMPEMSGPEAAAILSSQFEEMQILFMSGYTEKAIAHHGVLDNGIEFIHKPITPKTLSRAVSNCLRDPLGEES